MEIKLPNKTNDLRIEHFNALQNPYFLTEEKLDIMDQLEFIHLFTNISRPKLKRINATDIAKMFSHIVRLYSGIKVNKPPKEITLNGIKFELINAEKVGVGWHADFSKGDMKKDPVYFGCLFYFPKGAKYGAVDENDNLLNPIADRYEIIKEHMPLDVFMNASAFFLSKIKQSMQISVQILKTRKTIEKILNLLNLHGKKASM
jgi:hypothetical protein